MMTVGKLLAHDGPFSQLVRSLRGSIEYIHDGVEDGFHLTLENGVQLSVIYHSGASCDKVGLAATEVEIAIGREGEGIWRDDDDDDDAPLPEQVVGWVPVEDIASIASAVHDERWATLRYIARGRNK